MNIEANNWTYDLRRVNVLVTVETRKGVQMIPVQYRDSETEEILELRHEESAPTMGSRVRLHFRDYDVVYRWKCVPTCCIVYVRRAMAEKRESIAA